MAPASVGVCGLCPTPLSVVAEMVEMAVPMEVSRIAGLHGNGQVPRLSPHASIREQLVLAEKLAVDGRCAQLLGANEEDCELVKGWLSLLRDMEGPLYTLLSPNRKLFDELPLQLRAMAVRAHCKSSAAAQAVAELTPVLRDVNKHLARGGPFLVGESFTLADICGVFVIIDVFRLALPAPLRRHYGALLQWLNMCLKMPAFAALDSKDGCELCKWSEGEERAFENRVVEAMANRSSCLVLPLPRRSQREDRGSPRRTTCQPQATRRARRLPSPPARPPPVPKAPGEQSKLPQPPNRTPPQSAELQPPTVDDQPLSASPSLRLPVQTESFEIDLLPKPNCPPLQQSVASVCLQQSAIPQHARTSEEAPSRPHWLSGLASSLGLSPDRIGLCILDFAQSEYGVAPCISVEDDLPLEAAANTTRQRDENSPCDPWDSSDPWSHRADPPQGSGVQRSSKQDPWFAYQRSQSGPSTAVVASTTSTDAGTATTAVRNLSFQASDDFFKDLCGCSRQEFLLRNVDHKLQDQSSFLQLSDAELFQLGQRPLAEQAEHFHNIQKDKEAEPAMDPTGIEGKHTEAEERTWWEDTDYEENLFWWRGDPESLCFDVQLTPVDMLTTGAPPSDQWWDVDKLAESDDFVAVLKPAGMFVVTTQKGLWEVSATNFIHVAHQRFRMPSRDEPRQRGICHRLDSHTSGVQILGKSWHAFRHFVGQNASHRVQKEYIALVEGRLGGEDDPGMGVVDVPLVKWQDFAHREFGSVLCSKEGLPAVTKYRALRQWRVPARGLTKFWGRDRWFTLVQLRILTGRTHQIRVHMAFIGHPLVCDAKYNPSRYEEDCALVPRIFLHSLRMEFADVNGEQFLAASDLAPDLQVALMRIQELVASSAEDRSVSAAAVGFPGLAAILQLSEKAGAVAPMSADNAGEAFSPRALVQRCCSCGEYEEAHCSMVQRGRTFAKFWCLRKHDKSAGPLTQQTESSWGPGALWVPCALQQPEIAKDADLQTRTTPQVRSSGSIGAPMAGDGRGN